MRYMIFVSLAVIFSAQLGHSESIKGRRQKDLSIPAEALSDSERTELSQQALRERDHAKQMKKSALQERQSAEKRKTESK